jgi:hypothetical protein
MQRIATFEIINTKPGKESFYERFTIRYDTMFPPLSVARSEAERIMCNTGRRFTKTMIVRVCE